MPHLSLKNEIASTVLATLEQYARLLSPNPAQRAVEIAALVEDIYTLVETHYTKDN